METLAFLIFTGMIGYVFYWSIRFDDIQTRIDELKNRKKVNLEHPNRRPPRP